MSAVTEHGARIAANYYARYGLPIGPLKEAIDDAFALAEATNLDVYLGAALVRAYRRGLAAGFVSLETADRLCCTILHTHPCLLWPEQYWTVKIRRAGVRRVHVPRTPIATEFKSGTLAR